MLACVGKHFSRDNLELRIFQPVRLEHMMPLPWAVSNGHKVVVKLLLEKMDVKSKTWTALGHYHMQQRRDPRQW